jgi:predicted DCC family thiol-disulfide oxidoreductase YuxK
MNQLNELLNKQPILLFDGNCGFCNKTVLYFLSREKKTEDLPKGKKMHFAALDSNEGQLLKKYFDIDPSTDSLILIKDYSAYIKSCAALRLSRYMKQPWPLAMMLLAIPPFIRNFGYDFVAKRRMKLAGRVESCALLTEEDQSRFLDQSSKICS